MSVWLEVDGVGSLVDSREAAISVFDHGLTVGDGVFETLSIRDAQPIALTRHLRRLAASCAVLGLPCPIPSAIADAVRAVIDSELEACAVGRLRITVTGGRSPLGSDRGRAVPSWIVAATPVPEWPHTTSAILLPWRRNEFSSVHGAKTTSYAENVVALQWARDRGFSEGLYLNTAGFLCEGTGTNVFIVARGRIITPPLESGCLAGITRGLVLEWTKAEEGNISEEDLMGADEVFLTSSTRDVHPVLDLGGQRRWEGVGPVTASIQGTFGARIVANPDPW